MTKLTNLEKIKAAWAMGWSAVLEGYDKTGCVVASSLGCFYINWKDSPIQSLLIEDDSEYADSFKITGYLYAGQLFGESKIPEGQRFRVRESKYNEHIVGAIVSFKEKRRYAITVYCEEDCDAYSKGELLSLPFEELEPYFD